MVFPSHAHLPGEPNAVVVRPVQALTVYFDRAADWSRTHAAELFHLLLQHIRPNHIRWFRTSHTVRWRPVDEDLVPVLAEHLRVDTLHAAVRHLFRVEVADRPDAPNLAFSYCEADPMRGAGMGWARIVLPFAAAPDELAEMARTVAARFPIWVGTAGYSTSWNRAHEQMAFNTMYAWSHRARGVDIQAPDLQAQTVELGLPGISWMNLVSRRAADAFGLDLAQLLREPLEHGGSVTEYADVLLLQTGDRPELADVNALSMSLGLEELGARLTPYLAPPLAEFPGTFEREGHTERWMQRFAR